MAIHRSTSLVTNFYDRAQSRIPEAITSPSIWLRSYEDFVTKNASAVSQMESTLRSLTYIIPGRFRESEVTSESLHSFIQLLSLYHTSLLSAPLSRPSPHHRYTKYWSAQSPLYKRAAVLLQTIQYTELLCEMAGRRRGEKLRWRVVVVLEFVKALCRLVLMRITGSRPLVTPALAEREGEVKPEADDNDEDGIDGRAHGDWVMPRTGLRLLKLPDGDEIIDYLANKVLTADDIKGPKRLLRRVTSVQGKVAEVMWILRPLVYALAMQRLQGKRKDWRPWALGAALEVAARQLAQRDLKERVAGGLRGLTALESEEMRKRGRALGWWVMRGAFYENITKSWVHGVISKLKGKPILDMVGGIVEEYEYLWDEYHFATSSM